MKLLTSTALSTSSEPTIIRNEMMTMSEKVRTGIYISEDLLRECDEYLSKNGGSRSELLESALRLYLATRKIKEKSEVLVPELAECISAAGDEGITKISKGLFRYAVEVEMLIALLAETFEISKNHLKDVRREAVNNVREREERSTSMTLSCVMSVRG